MNPFQIEIKPTNNPTILKFVAKRFLTQHESFEFANIDEASNSPLAQQLFYLPFVKTVYIAQNFVAIQKYDIVEWEDVQLETAEEISNYLKQEKPVIIEPTEKSQKTTFSVSMESTPNPEVMKFISDQKMLSDVLEFKNSAEAKQAPLAQALFQFPFVKELFFDDNFISVTKHEFVQWDAIAQELREFIQTYLEEGKPVVEEGIRNKSVGSISSKVEKNRSNESLDAISKEIISILDEYVKPAVARDGGNIVFNTYNAETKNVQVILQGACSGCPSSTITLKNGIETMLKEMLPGKVETVEAMND
ncbi:MAG TPA: NifU family protein [Flavobacteriaceae bacterium]|nr:NifU family protein [Flavobacteriaceae bacterium]